MNSGKTTEDASQPLEKEIGREWKPSKMAVKAQEEIIQRGDHEEKRIVVYRREEQTYASLETGEPETTERWVKIASLTEQASTETLFALAESHGYELEAK